ncbi:MAG TPA: sulfotransferase [Steroidobacteraceae bacterium]
MTRPSPAGTPDILELEARLDTLLWWPRVTAETFVAAQLAATRWSEAVWDVAAAAGPVELAATELSRGLEVAHRPVFVCGVHRSGTTLVQGLLDGHPAVAMLPSEGTFLTSFERRLRRLPREHWLPFLGCEWLRRLANPIHQHPYWLLGRSATAHMPYVEFARILMAWWAVAERRIGSATSLWPIVAVALAFAHSTGSFSADSALQWWAEKTPTNERYLSRLRVEFPDGKLIHVVRHPFAIYASHKQAARNSRAHLQHTRRILLDLNLSYRVAVAQARSHASDHYLLVRYEDLVENPRRTSDRLAAFLHIEPLPILLHPTVAGLPALGNSSFAADPRPGSVHAVARPSWTDTLTPFDRERLTAVVAEGAASLGYELTPLAPWRARLLRLATRIGSSSVQ